MINFFAGQDKLVETIFKAKLAETYNIPEEPEFPEEEEEIPEPDPEPVEGSSTTKGRKRVQRKIGEGGKKAQEEANEAKEKAKEEIKQKKEDTKKAVSQAKEDITKEIENAIANNQIAFQEYLADFKDLGVSIGELTISCVTLPSRLASLAGSIIVVCPMGPGANVPAIPKGIQDLKQIGDDLGTKYDKVMNGIKKVGLDQLSKLASNPVVIMMGLSAGLASAATLASSITSTLSALKPMIMAVGGMVGDEGGSTPSVDTPQTAGYTASADTCVTFAPLVYYDNEGHYEVSCNNCKNYSAVDPSDARSCQNCLKYKQNIK